MRRKLSVMTIDLPDQLTARLRVLADQQGRALDALIEEAIRRFLEDAAITDLQPADVAATQEAFAAELPDVPSWNQPRETTDDATQ
ncbi:MAG: ribbon-helix-helix protein, CopG family [bacterium]|nr:ribbon-helix-helix protein, CopG family [bacterium]